MIDKIIELAMRQRLLVILFALVIIGVGYVAFTQLPIDAFPDVTPVLVQIFTEAEGLSPEEVEKLVTYPIEVAIVWRCSMAWCWSRILISYEWKD